MPGDDWLALSDDDLLAHCRIDRYRASGPGGQHRNRNDTAVRIVHPPTGAAATGTERRSQALNRTAALRRLRREIALRARRPVDLDAYHPPARLQAILPAGAPAEAASKHQRIGPRHRDFWLGAQALLDLLDAVDWAVSDAAALIGCSTAQLTRLITSEPRLQAAVNNHRRSSNLRPLR